MPAPRPITPARPAPRIGTSEAPDVRDLRDAGDAAADPRRLPTARARPRDAVAAAAPGPAGRKVVVAGRRGRKLSEGAAALPRRAGIAAKTLEGGPGARAAAGLPAVSVGPSRRHRDDRPRLEAGIALDDALWRWAREAHDEGRDRPAGQAA